MLVFRFGKIVLLSLINNNGFKSFLKIIEEVVKSFFDIYVTQKYYVYLHHYLYVSEQNKMDFLRRAADEFRDDLEELGDACTMLDHDVLGEMARIIDSPEIYYYESTIDILNEKLDKVKKTCEILNSSHEYRKMITLRKIRNTVDKILKR